RWQDQRRSGGSARNQHLQRLPHLADSQRCRDSASGTAGHAESDTAASERMTEGAAIAVYGANATSYLTVAPYLYRQGQRLRMRLSSAMALDREISMLRDWLWSFLGIPK